MSINNLSFSNCVTALTCCTDLGYIIYSLTDQLNKRKHMMLNGSTGLAKLYNNTNMILLIGGNTKPFKPKTTFVLFDDRDSSVKIEIDMKEIIKNALIVKDYIIIVLEKKVVLFKWTGELIYKITTYCNPNGLCVINQNTSTIITLGQKKVKLKYGILRWIHTKQYQRTKQTLKR